MDKEFKKIFEEACTELCSKCKFDKLIVVGITINEEKEIMTMHHYNKDLTPYEEVGILTHQSNLLLSGGKHE